MKVFIIGCGGREHAIAKKVLESPKVDQLYCAPGNAGMEEIAECVPIEITDLKGLAAFAQKEQIDLTIVGMDGPLVEGVVDLFQDRGLRIFGPTKKAAVIEGSKAFSKNLMKKYGIPTAAYETFTNPADAMAYLKTSSYPIVLKADGLALGKGVLICNTFEEARKGVKLIMEDKQFGTAGDCLVIEEFLTGREVSVLAFCDGTHILPMTSAQDHKRALDGDLGPNTGGMGTFSPSPFYTEEVDSYCSEHIYLPTMAAMKAEGREFVGVLFVGLILTEQGPKVIEYNARFGDPEAQVVLPRMKNDLVEVCEACIDGTLGQVRLEFEENATVCVIMASGGYPVSYKKGYEIQGLEHLRDRDDVLVFHAGTIRRNGKVLTNGGRVLGVTARGVTLSEARSKAYQAMEYIDFKDRFYRRDIGKAIEGL